MVVFGTLLKVIGFAIIINIPKLKVCKGDRSQQICKKIPNDEQMYSHKTILNRNVHGAKRAQITINSYEHES